MTTRLTAALAFGLLAACTSGVTIPEPTSVTEVPSTGTSSSSSFGAGDIVVPEGVTQADPNISTAVAAPGTGRRLDTDTLNLMQTTLEEQKIDAAVAEQKLAADRAQLVIVQPGALPNRVEGVNIALYAQQTTNAVGTRIYDRRGMSNPMSGACRRFANSDDAQRAFLANGGPQSDPGGLDPDGDGFACSWDPAPYRALKT